MDTINPNEMREYAAKLETERSNLSNKCTECDRLIRQLNQVFADDAYEKFAARYSAYKPTMESLCKCLEQYAKFLNEVSDKYEEFIRSATKKL